MKKRGRKKGSGLPRKTLHAEITKVSYEQLLIIKRRMKLSWPKAIAHVLEKYHEYAGNKPTS